MLSGALNQTCKEMRLFSGAIRRMIYTRNLKRHTPMKSINQIIAHAQKWSRAFVEIHKLCRGIAGNRYVTSSVHFWVV